MLKKEKVRLFWCYITPTLLIYTAFLVIPFLMTFYTSMTDWSGYSMQMNFTGLKNYKALIQDKLVWKAFEHNVYLFVIGAVFTFLLSVFFGVALTRMKLKMKNFYRVIFFFPNVLSIVIVSYIWMFIYNPNFGILNALLGAIGLPNLGRAWLGELDTVLPALAVPWIWMSVGFYMVLFIAAIENIPTSMYESAIIDGANQWQQTRKITMPLIWEIVRVSIVFFHIKCFQWHLYHSERDYQRSAGKGIRYPDDLYV